MPPRSKPISDFLLTLGSSGAAAGFGLLAIPLIAIYFSESEVGGFARFSALAGICTVLGVLRSDQIIALASDDREARTSTLVPVGASLFLALPAFALIAALSSSDEGASLVSIVVIGAWIPISTLQSAGIFFHQRRGDFKRPAWSKIIRAVVQVLGLGLLAAGLEGTLVLAISFTLAPLAGLLVLGLPAFGGGIDGRLSLAEVLARRRADLRLLALYSTPSIGLAQIVTQVPVVAFGYGFGDAASGTFYMARRLLLGSMQLVGIAIHQVFLPRWSRMRDAGIPFENEFRRLIPACLAVMAAVGIGLVLLVDIAIPRLDPGRWADLGWVSAWLLPAFVLAGGVITTRCYWIVSRRQKHELRVNLAGSLVVLVGLGAIFFTTFPNAVVWFMLAAVIGNGIMIAAALRSAGRQIKEPVGNGHA
ncbi:oligosaccharide flippase family protein [Phycisphaerales bacterium]|nr:oligosaccharide flippase family protein [Phycisphaerales bacterium]